MKNLITYYETYKKGDKEFTELYQNRLYDMTDDEFYKFIGDLAENAYYNDNHKIASVALGYFCIVEAMSQREADEYYNNHINLEAVG